MPSRAGAEGCRNLGHDRLRPRLGVLLYDEEAAHAFDQRRDIASAKLLAEQDQITFPVAEFRTMGDDLGTEQDAEFRGEFRRRPEGRWRQSSDLRPSSE